MKHAFQRGEGTCVYCDIIDTSTKQVIAGLKDELGREVQSEKAVEIVYQDGKLLKTVDQFGIGQVGR